MEVRSLEEIVRALNADEVQYLIVDALAALAVNAHVSSIVGSPTAFDTGFIPGDNSAARRCEMQCAIFLQRVTRNRLVPVYP